MRSFRHWNVNYIQKRIAYMIYAKRNPDKPQDDEPYLDVFNELNDNSTDIILVDGIFRGECALEAIKKVKSGGIIVVDNVNWFLPSNSISPSARTLKDGPLDAVWSDFAEKTQSWRRIWTTCDLSDTTFFFKP